VHAGPSPLYANDFDFVVMPILGVVILMKTSVEPDKQTCKESDIYLIQTKRVKIVTML
jgi:hypothetical protein